MLSQILNEVLDPKMCEKYGFTPENFLNGFECPARKSDESRTMAAKPQDSTFGCYYNRNKFQANLDVKDYKPEEITVKLTDKNTITVEAKHEERQDEHGFISRQFVRRYVVPENYDMEKLESRLSSEGVLSISAPIIDENSVEYKEIPIIRG